MRPNFGIFLIFANLVVKSLSIVFLDLSRYQNCTFHLSTFDRSSFEISDELTHATLANRGWTIGHNKTNYQTKSNVAGALFVSSLSKLDIRQVKCDLAIFTNTPQNYSHFKVGHFNWILKKDTTTVLLIFDKNSAFPGVTTFSNQYGLSFGNLDAMFYLILLKSPNASLFYHGAFEPNSGLKFRRVERLLGDLSSRKSPAGKVLVVGSGTKSICLTLTARLNWKCLGPGLILQLLEKHYNLTTTRISPFNAIDDFEVEHQANSVIWLPTFFYSSHSEDVPHGQFHYSPPTALFLLYCDRLRGGSVLGIDLGILLKPADLLTWLFTVGTFSLAGVLILKDHVFSVLLLFGVGLVTRQELHPKYVYPYSAKLYIILTLASICLSSGYEAFITSRVIVPNPATVFGSLTEFLNHGYKIHHSPAGQIIKDYSPEIIIRASTTIYIPVFNRTGNLGRLIQSFKLADPMDKQDSSYVFKKMRETKLGLISQDNLVKALLNTIKGNGKGMRRFAASCHVMKESLLSQTKAWLFLHHHAVLFKHFVQTFDENGLGTWYADLGHWILEFRHYQSPEGPVKLSLFKSRVLTVFGFYACCLFWGGSSFLIEQLPEIIGGVKAMIFQRYFHRVHIFSNQPQI